MNFAHPSVYFIFHVAKIVEVVDNSIVFKGFKLVYIYIRFNLLIHAYKKHDIVHEYAASSFLSNGNLFQIIYVQCQKKKVNKNLFVSVLNYDIVLPVS